MPTLPRISIVVPSYNQAPYLEATLQSLFAQDYPELEVIVIDGGSNDGSAEIIRRHADRLIYWVSELDKGQSDALVKGFARATGDVLGWLCSDDLLKPGALLLAGAAFAADPRMDLLYGDTEYLYPDGFIQPKPRVAYDYEIMLRSFNLVPQPSSFFRRSAYDRAGGIDPSLHYAMDYDLFIRFGSEAIVRHVPVTLSTYRLHPTSKTASERAKFDAEWARVRSRALGHALGVRDTFWRYFYLAKVVLKFGVERGEWKFGYDNRKYELEAPPTKAA